MQIATHIEKQIISRIKDEITRGGAFPITYTTERGIKHTIAKEEISTGNLIATLDVESQTYLIYLMK